MLNSCQSFLERKPGGGPWYTRQAPSGPVSQSEPIQACISTFQQSPRPPSFSPLCLLVSPPPSIMERWLLQGLREVSMLQACRSADEFERLNHISEGTYGIVYRWALRAASPLSS